MIALERGEYMFNSPYFYWKGKSCKDFFLMVLTEDTDILHDIGVPYKKALTKDGNNYIEDENDTDEITLSLWLTDGTIPLVWTRDTYKKVTNWLKSDEFEEFVSYDDLETTYYLKVTNIQKRFTHESLGCIDVTFKPVDNYGYEKVVINKKISGQQIIEIENPTDEVYEPYIVIKNFGVKDGIIRINNMVLTNIEKGEVVYIDNYMTNIKNQNNENKLMYSNREWIRLKPGYNQIFIEANCNIEIICNFPIAG